MIAGASRISARSTVVQSLSIGIRRGAVSKHTKKQGMNSLTGCSRALDKWLNCTGCRLHKTRRNVVLGRGALPARVLLIGEAPGVSEDLRGLPFVGRSGNILEKALAKAREELGGRLPSYAITNVVGCLPTDPDADENFRTPKWKEVIACRPRLRKLLVLCQPSHIIFLGKVAEECCKTLCPDGLPFRHPSYLLRIGGTQSTEYKKFVRDLIKVFRAARVRRS